MQKNATKKQRNHVGKEIFNEKINKNRNIFVNLHKKTFNFGGLML